MFDVKLACPRSQRSHCSLIPHGIDDRPSSKRESDQVFANSLCGIDVIVYTWKILRRHLHKSTWFYVIIKRMRKQWIPGALFSPSAPGFEAT